MAPYPATLGVILAGGLARRMGGGDKPLLRLGGQTLLAHVAQRLAPQCESMILNANGDLSRFGMLDIPVVQDSISDNPGPLAGVLAALEWAALHKPSITWVATVPGDTPFIPRDLVLRLHAARDAASTPLACAASGANQHYTTCLWPVDLRHDMRHALLEGMRRVEDWMKLHGSTAAFWPAEPFDPFFNINTPDDLAAAQDIFERHTSMDTAAARTGGYDA
ncbi:molybdenum cofactor guanylyltransferase MobA [Microvirga guangxiensis]|uniref:Molybdenum cofactor guanylyltransferase n=1 Tax=Microvirga guangxiensis TaxID=549386 RepID=A0A1G5CJ72_9HYPH|nr:molybdenum cofactor guanylyltransferase MobA [Microvirga guangxiensis]SCY02357.1 molybdenum cofactor guanylyltransferase [Microvirga guangxiensis]